MTSLTLLTPGCRGGYQKGWRLKACFFCYRWRDCGTAGEPRRL